MCIWTDLIFDKIGKSYHFLLHFELLTMISFKIFGTVDTKLNDIFVTINLLIDIYNLL